MTNQTTDKLQVVSKLSERTIRIYIARELGYRYKDVDFEWEYDSSGAVVGIRVIEKVDWYRT